MQPAIPAIDQPDPPLPPSQTLPTMYDLLSEDPEEPGLPDEFHDLQPQLLSRTLRLTDYAAGQWFTSLDKWFWALKDCATHLRIAPYFLAIHSKSKKLLA